MGNIFSYAAPEEPPSVVLVPPLIDSRERGRSRFAKSSYDRAFGQQQMRILFNDFLPYDTRGTLRFSPPEDRRVSVVAKLRHPKPIAPTPSKHSSKVNTTNTIYTNEGPEGKMTLRYQPDPNVPWTFLDVKAKAGITSGSTATIRGCYLNPASHTAVFGVLPLLANNGDGAVTTDNLRLGLRYTTPTFSTGIITLPAVNTLHSAWAVGRAGGLLWGIQTQPNLALDATGIFQDGQYNHQAWGGIASSCKEALSWGVAYQPEGQSAYGRGVFTASVELRRQRELVVSFLHHMVTQRNVMNPLEKNDVVGISNYLDLAFQMVTDLSASGSSASSTMSSSGVGVGSGSGIDSRSINGRYYNTSNSGGMRLAAAWQANKNIQLKARVSLDGAAAGVILKSWWQPAFTLGLAISKPFVSGVSAPARLGVTATLESYKALRYERSAEGQKMSGARVTQRHVASEEDLAYHSGQGLLVPLEEVDNPEVLGQKAPSGADFL
ncbi:hypothetical protein Ndes2526B_g00602 [Nannochloris sp. 'desiccata']